jgi:hypothetical protein
MGAPGIQVIAYTARMQFSAEIELLKLLAAGERRQVASRVLSRAVDLQSLADFLEGQEMGLYFSHQLESLQLDRLFPAAFLEKLRWQREAQRLQRTALVAALEVLQREFADAGVDFILTKGLHLADTYWAGVENRFTWDLDILVEAERLSRAVQVLQQAGFESVHAGALGSRLVRHFSHAQEFTGHGVAVDLHWIFRPRPGHRLDYAAIWRRKRSWVYNDVQYSVLSGVDTLLMLLLGIAEDVERAQPNYRKLWDIYLMLRSDAVHDWGVFLFKAREQGVERLVVAMLALTCQALQCRDEFPELARSLDEREKECQCSAAEIARALSRRPLHPGNRLWVARLQPVSAPYYLLWWTLTAPMRYLVWR